MNTMICEKLQYNELKEIVKSHCVSSLGEELLDKLQPSSNRLNDTTEARNLLNAENHLPLKRFSNISHQMSFNFAKKSGMMDNSYIR